MKDPKKNSKRLLSILTRAELEGLGDQNKAPWRMDKPHLIAHVLAEWDQGAVERIVTRIMRDAARENGG